MHGGYGHAGFAGRGAGNAACAWKVGQAHRVVGSSGLGVWKSRRTGLLGSSDLCMCGKDACAARGSCESV